MVIKLLIIKVIAILLCYRPLFILSDSLNPRRPKTEEEFFQLKHHESVDSINQTIEQLKIINNRRNFKPWLFDNADTLNSYNDFIKIRNSVNYDKYPPNVIIMLADDLGYGDLGFNPFYRHCEEKDFPCCEGSILTPNLHKMAKKGTMMTNFHSASPVCSPARVAVMTGLFPWRLGALNAFELGRDLSQRNGFLPHILTSAEIFKGLGYYTIHSGKWHLGGMREEYRVKRTYKDICTDPSPNQHGFETYISELDGPESARYTYQLGETCLHSRGTHHLLLNDIPLPFDGCETLAEICRYYNYSTIPQPTILSDREANDVVNFIRQHWNRQKDKEPELRQPFFANLWFNAPHGPWEVLDTGLSLYNEKYNKSKKHWQNYRCPTYGDLWTQRRWEYKTMVSAMDISIGKVLDVLEELNLEKSTIILFTSDNGPEVQAGTPGVYKEGKRSLLEGGIRVPTIFQWVDKIPSNSVSTIWGSNVDIIPTVLDAIGFPNSFNANDKPSDEIDNKITLRRLSNSITNYLPNFLTNTKQSNSNNNINSTTKLLNYLSTNPLRFDGISLMVPLTNAIKFDSLIDKNNNSLGSHVDNLSLDEFLNILKDIYIYEHQHHHHKHHQSNYISTHLSSHQSNHLTAHISNHLTTHLSRNLSNGVDRWIGVDRSIERIHLWHKDTEKFRNDERIQSSAYYKDLKIITSGPGGCLDRIYDLRHDPYEDYNLIVGPRCHVTFNNWNDKKIEDIIAKDSAKGHCKSPNSNLNDNEVDICLLKYYHSLVSRIKLIYPKLVAFVKHGNDVHQRFLREESNKVTCDIPRFPLVKPWNFTTSLTCENDLTCSEPLYIY